jgi:hypothetical protein
MKNVIILRGVSGAGKSTVATLFGNAAIVCADDYFTDSWGLYKFDAKQLPQAHAQCQKRFMDAMNNPDVDTVVVANTNIFPAHFAFYEEQAQEFNARVFHLVIENRHGGVNEHDVPDTVLMNMEKSLRKHLTLR